ncbi:uncharacterized protein G2W53_033007 [Senna tora]|uniref:Uncharacterized protein n=1 Tax=Senna tora TaxID=362788 RepID=A0A834WAN1_9FABA|nr:uncharacterized protein G2W53_033007 [Senna tora]
MPMKLPLRAKKKGKVINKEWGFSKDPKYLHAPTPVEI